MRSVRANQSGRHSETPELRRSECLDDLRAGVAGRAPIEKACGVSPADLVLIRTPPDDRLAARLVQRAGAARQRESKVDGRLPRGNARKHAVPYDVPREVLIETEVNERLDEIARLRVPDGNRMRNRACDRVCRAGGICRGTAEERHDVARCGQSDPQHEWILCRVDQLVQLRRVEAVLEAQLGGIRCAGERGAPAIRKGPRLPRHGCGPSLDARRALRGVHCQTGRQLFEIGRWVGRRRVSHRAQTNRDGVRAGRHVVEARDDRTGEGRSVPIPRDGDDDSLV